MRLLHTSFLTLSTNQGTTSDWCASPQVDPNEPTEEEKVELQSLERKRVQGGQAKCFCEIKWLGGGGGV